MGIGIDIVDIKRIANVENLAKHILHEKEYELFLKRHDKEQFLAGRFAGKEAFLKSLELGLGDIPLKDICILNKPNGAPFLVHDNKTYQISISHEKSIAIAIVLS